MTRCKAKNSTGTRCIKLGIFKSRTLCKKHWNRYCRRQKRVRYERSKICQVLMHMLDENPFISDKEVKNTIHALAGLSVLNAREVHETIDAVEAVIQYKRRLLAAYL